MEHLGFLVELRANAVPAELADDRVAVAFGEFLYGVTDVAQVRAGTNRANPAPHRLDDRGRHRAGPLRGRRLREHHLGHPRDEVGTQLAEAARDRPARWVWIYHAPPAGTPLCHDGRRTFPDHELAEWIGRHNPDLVFCGHIHQAPWVEGGTWHLSDWECLRGSPWYARLGETWVFNAGKQIGKVPPHITLDTEAATADWFGVFSSEKVSLDAQ